MIHPLEALEVLKTVGGGVLKPPEEPEYGEDYLDEYSDFTETPIYGFSGTVPADNVFFWLTQPKGYGDRAPHMQGTQDCVSHSFGVGLEDWYLNLSGFWPGEVATEVIYGGARVNIGEKKLTVPGASCSWAAQFLLRYGYLPRGSYTGEDLTEYNPIRANRYGRDGLPNVIPSQLRKVLSIDTAKPIRIGKLPKGESAWTAVGQLCPLPFATRRGFSDTRQEFGICKPINEWNHSMLVRGRCILANGAKCFAVQNSIGDYLGDSNREVKLLSGDKVLLPPGVFLVEYEVFDDICVTEDVYVMF